MDCTGCGKVFEQTHLLRAHCNTFRCGGRWRYTPELRLEDKTVEDRKNTLYSNNYLKRPKDAKTGHARVIHKARTPGTICVSRLPGGSSFRNNWEYPEYPSVINLE